MAVGPGGRASFLQPWGYGEMRCLWKRLPHAPVGEAGVQPDCPFFSLLPGAGVAWAPHALVIPEPSLELPKVQGPSPQPQPPRLPPGQLSSTGSGGGT